MTDATTQAKKLIKAAGHDPGKAEGCPGTHCSLCDAAVDAESTISRLGFTPATLAAAITLAQAHLERPPSEHDGGCCAGISKLPCECSAKDRKEALDAWEKLFEKEADNE